MTQLTDHQIALKAATRRAVTLAGGPVMASKALRVDQARLSRYGNPDDPAFVPVDVAIDLDRLAGDCIIARCFAELAGCKLEPHDLGSNRVPDLAKIAGSIALEAGEVVAEAIEASTDGKISPNEARRILEKASDAKDKIIDLEAATRQRLAVA